MSTTDPVLLTARQAASRLGVKIETLYAYVSRGELPNHRKRGTRASLFLERDVERLRARGRSTVMQSGTIAVLETQLTTLTDGVLRYRGRPATDLAVTYSFERVAEWLWSGEANVFEGSPPTWQATNAALQVAQAIQHCLPEQTPLADRLRLIVAGAAPVDALRYQTSANTVHTIARALLSTMAHALPMQTRSVRTRQTDAGDSLRYASALWSRLTNERPGPGMVRILNAALVLLCDHELATSTFASRVAASVRADPYSTVLAGMGAVAGRLHGGVGPRMVQLFERIERPANAVPVLADFLKHERRLPGLGHPLYPDGDPRAQLLLSMLRALRLNRWQSQRLAVVQQVLQVVGTPQPNVDFALASICYLARMPPDVAEGIFTLARTAGWIAHVLEEYREPPLRFRLRAEYTGVQ